MGPPVQGVLPSIGSSPWAAPTAWAELWPIPAPWGQAGHLEQAMPLAQKLSKQAALLVCSPAKQRILFLSHIPCPWLIPHPWGLQTSVGCHFCQLP